MVRIGHSAGMVDMTMGHQDFLQHDAVLLDRTQDARNITARIDHRRTLRLIAPQQAAVLFKRRDGDDLVLDGHGGSQRRTKNGAQSIAAAGIHYRLRPRSRYLPKR